MRLLFLIGCISVNVRSAVHRLFSQGSLQSAVENIAAFGIADGVSSSVLRGGKEEGSMLVTIKTGAMTITVSPSRGMNVISALVDGKLVGWTNPVQEVVNPIHINQLARGGSGFLDGFRETVVRCGYEWAGHAGMDNGEMLTLHGLASTLPATSVTVDITDSRVTLTGHLREAAFKKSDFSIVTELSVEKGAKSFTLTDTLTNNADYESEYMTIYHSNFGAPFLEEGSKIYLPAKEVSPFNNGKARDLIENWYAMQGPTVDYDETVYNIYVNADATNQTLAVLTNAALTQGISVTWSVTTLPVFGLWKNLDTLTRGYVVGIEPGTSFSYNRKFNRQIGLVPKIKPRSSVTFKLTYDVLTTTNEVQAKLTEVDKIQGSNVVSLVRNPLSLEEEESSLAYPLMLSSPLLAVLYILTAQA